MPFGRELPHVGVLPVLLIGKEYNRLREGHKQRQKPKISFVEVDTLPHGCMVLPQPCQNLKRAWPYAPLWVIGTRNNTEQRNPTPPPPPPSTELGRHGKRDPFQCRQTLRVVKQGGLCNHIMSLDPLLRRHPSLVAGFGSRLFYSVFYSHDI